MDIVKAFITGNLANDPELRRTTNGISVCTFTVISNRSETAKSYLNIVAWRERGENCARELKKGSRVAIIGEIQTRSYETKSGEKRYVTEIVADEVELVTGVQHDDSLDLF